MLIAKLKQSLFQKNTANLFESLHSFPFALGIEPGLLNMAFKALDDFFALPNLHMAVSSQHEDMEMSPP
jgi:hypothetical protein